MASSLDAGWSLGPGEYYTVTRLSARRHSIGISFIVYFVLTFILLWLGVRWPFRRSLLVALLVGLVVDALTDWFVASRR
jgi:hypothetical protein